MQYRLRTLLITVTAIGVMLAWWLDHKRLSSHLRMREQQIGQLQRQVSQRTGYFLAPGIRFKTPDELVAFLKDGSDDDFVREEWGGWIGSHLSEQAVPQLIELLRYPNEDTRRHAAILLGWIGQKKCPSISDPIPALISAMDDSSRIVRVESTNAIRKYGPLAKEALPRLRQDMLRDNSYDAFKATLAVKDIDRTADIGPRLRDLFLAGEKGVRENVASYLPDHLPAAEAKQILMAQYERETSQEMQAALAQAMNKVKE